MRAFTITADQFVNLPAHEVSRAVLDRYFDYQTSWDPTIQDLVPGEDRTSRVGATARVARTFRGRTEIGSCEITSFSPNECIEVEFRFERTNELRKISCDALVHGGARVRVDITSDLRGLARVVAPLSRQVLSRGLTNSLHGLKVAVEASTTHG